MFLGCVIVKLADDKRRDHRTEVANAGVHAPNTAGIWGGRYGAHSIVMSGGYEDDVDNGDSMCVADICSSYALAHWVAERTQERAVTETIIGTAEIIPGGTPSNPTRPSTTGTTMRCV